MQAQIGYLVGANLLLKQAGAVISLQAAERGYHLSTVHLAGQEWRKKHGLPANPSAYGALTDGPDYSFVDGRPTPPGTGKIKRAEKQLTIAQKIMELSKEVDFAVELHQQKTEQEEQRRANIIKQKLKPKEKELQD